MAITLQNVCLLNLNVVTTYKRQYPKATIEDALTRVKEPVVGSIGMCMEEVIPELRAAYVVTNLRVTDTMLVGDITSLDTPSGRLMERVLETAGENAFVFRINGYGVLSEDGIVSNYDLLSIGMVKADQG